MHYRFRNVTTAFNQMTSGIDTGMIPTVEKESRNGPVMKIPDPVIITYENPQERVLLNPYRDANPFFHLYESLWMLVGRNDVKSLSYFSSKIGQFSDNGKTFNGAYGYRWRKPTAGIDQLEVLVDHLRKNPNSRRAVLQMWNVNDDLMKIDNQFHNYSKDVCCNLSVKFSIRTEGVNPVLDMTVFNRSNDMILGLFGANVVHFSFLQDYVAGRLGIGVGRYHQITDDLHVYKSNWFPNTWKQTSPINWTKYIIDYPKPCVSLGFNGDDVHDSELLAAIDTVVQQAPDWSRVESLPNLLNDYQRFQKLFESSKFLAKVAVPMFFAFAMYKTGFLVNAIVMAESIESKDWSIACRSWLFDRWLKRRVKNGYSTDPYSIRSELEQAKILLERNPHFEV